MKISKNLISQQSVFSFNEVNIANVEGLSNLLGSFSKRITISYSGYSTAKTVYKPQK